jgi:hypothetical protein
MSAQRLRDILDNIDLVGTFTSGLAYTDFESDRKTVYAVIRALEISEATRRLPGELKGRYDRQLNGQTQGIRHGPPASAAAWRPERSLSKARTISRSFPRPGSPLARPRRPGRERGHAVRFAIDAFSEKHFQQRLVGHIPFVGERFQLGQQCRGESQRDRFR